MQLSNIREWFVEDSGRYDLWVASSGADNGANKYINAGVRLLDRLNTNVLSEAEHIVDIAADQYKLQMKNCRAVKSVYVSDSDGRKKLEKVRFHELRSELHTEPESYADTGEPDKYAISVIGRQPELESITTSDVTYDYGNLLFSAHQEYVGIYWMPPADKTYTISVFGKFYSKELTAEDDENYWSVNHPELVVQAATYTVDVHFNNRARATALLERILFNTTGIEYDFVEQNTQDITQMEG